MDATRRFTITIRRETAERLTALARVERRDPRDQAALFIELALAGARPEPQSSSSEPQQSNATGPDLEVDAKDGPG